MQNGGSCKQRWFWFGHMMRICCGQKLIHSDICRSLFGLNLKNVRYTYTVLFLRIISLHYSSQIFSSTILTNLFVYEYFLIQENNLITRMLRLCTLRFAGYETSRYDSSSLLRSWITARPQAKVIFFLCTVDYRQKTRVTCGALANRISTSCPLVY